MEDGSGTVLMSGSPRKTRRYMVTQGATQTTNQQRITSVR